MIRAVRAVRVLPLLLLPLLLVSCGTEEAGAGADTGSTADTGTGKAGADKGTGSSADPAELAARAGALGIAPELVYVTEAPGFAVAEQSVGVFGGDGFHAAYFSQKTHAQLELFVDRGTLTAENCPQTQVGQGSGESVACERDGNAWYRKAGGRHEYAVPRDGHVIRLVGDAKRLDRAVLRKAAKATHHPDAAELTALLPPAPEGTATEPVERGDLPPVGDGAPNNEVGASG
ncbi:hypothetical protein FHS35_003408 [Streptomyces umbrinus]|uniref:hypothetical protein n=1 Tax=Streptomyces umbrinus TaxID=67370 RepID=UPI00167CD547|nr:hypothetical protein [Streptomyces umbrinus]MCR3726556.1 hypothetical protein [Streptomyces umbrinus]GHH33222.1 membrane protein [Streptomyces umbrinus]